MRHPPPALPLLAIALAALWGAAGFGCIDLSTTADHWELRGAHLAVTCEGCHPQEDGFEGAPTRCIGCHADDKPSGHYDGDCGECHTEDGWGDGVANHAFFPLEHAHAIACDLCHDGDDYEGLSSACQSCHEDERPDDHYEQFDCAGCHEPTSWDDGVLGHDFFPLYGGHDIACQECHLDDQDYSGLSQVCASCHEADRPDDHWDGQDCADCHLITDWTDASIDHDFFPLEHAHDITCSACHDDGWDGLDSSCQACHEADRPNGHFDGMDCEDCHEPTDWDHGQFDHDPLFPLPHRGVDSCDDCHTDAPDYDTFSCIDCHEHRCSEMNDEHDDVNNYECDSDACFDCHPDGRE